MRKRLFEIIEIGKDKDTVSKIYDAFMMITIIVSVVPLAFTQDYVAFGIIDKVTVSIFIIDYILRWITSDYKYGKGVKAFLLYPIRPMAFIDLLSILPSVLLINQTFKLLKIVRLLRTMRVLRALKGFRYSKNISLLMRVFKKQRDILLVVGTLMVGYILMTALVMLNIEPETFKNFFNALYWATISLTTVGYGDMYATTIVGKTITMVSSIFGIAIVALPAGIITAGYMEELENQRKGKEEDE